MSAATKRLHGQIKAKHRKALKAATNAAEKMAADQQYQEAMRAAGFEWSPTDGHWLRAAVLEQRREKKREVREYALSVRKELG